MAMDMAQQQLEEMLASGQMQEQVFVMVLMVLPPAGLDGPDGLDGLGLNCWVRVLTSRQKCECPHLDI